jgi:hypothetical protein
MVLILAPALAASRSADRHVVNGLPKACQECIFLGAPHAAGSNLASAAHVCRGHTEQQGCRRDNNVLSHLER